LPCHLPQERLARQRAEDDAAVQASLRQAAERRVAEAGVNEDISAESLRQCTEQAEELLQRGRALEARALKADMRAAEATERWEHLRGDAEGRVQALVEARGRHAQLGAQRTHALLHVEKLRGALAGCRGDLAAMGVQRARAEEAAAGLRARAEGQAKALVAQAAAVATLQEVHMPAQRRRAEGAERTAREAHAQMRAAEEENAKLQAMVQTQREQLRIVRATEAGLLGRVQGLQKTLSESEAALRVRSDQQEKVREYEKLRSTAGKFRQLMESNMQVAASLDHFVSQCEGEGSA
jgi:chromosome segregation ATPase